MDWFYIGEHNWSSGWAYHNDRRILGDKEAKASSKWTRGHSTVVHLPRQLKVTNDTARNVAFNKMPDIKE
jgi:hypothetical protein